MSSSTLRSIVRSDRFAASSSSLLLVDSDFRIQGANDEYLAVSGRSLDQLHGVEVFEAFPDNPDDSFADGIFSLTTSFERTMHSRTRDALPTQRYDVRDERGSGMFVTRYWNTVNSAVTDDDGRVIGVLHRVYEVQRPLAQQSSSASDVLTRLRAENDELRRALDSRPLIEQAKGLLMAERECSATKPSTFWSDVAGMERQGARHRRWSCRRSRTTCRGSKEFLTTGIQKLYGWVMTDQRYPRNLPLERSLEGPAGSGRRDRALP